MKMKSHLALIIGLTMCLPAIAQTASSGAPMSSDQIKKEAQAQKKAGEAKEKWAKAQENTQKKQKDLEKAQQEEAKAQSAATRRRPPARHSSSLNASQGKGQPPHGVALFYFRLRLPHQLLRSATMGSIRDARRAGIIPPPAPPPRAAQSPPQTQ